MKHIPLVKPAQFDNYLFKNWKAPVFSGLYDNFHIEKIENYKDHLIIPTPPHRRSVYFLLFLTQGVVVRTKGLNKYELKQNSCFCLAADQITGIDYVSDDAAGYYIHFLPDIFNNPNLKIDIGKDLPFFSLLKEPHFEISNPEKIKNLFTQLSSEYQSQNKSLISFYLITLLFEIQNNSISKETDKKDASAMLTLKYKNALSEFIYSFKTVAEFADQLSVSPNHLLKCVKNTTGKSARELLEEMRILEAKVLLKQTDMSIGEIAFKIGKYEPSDFARFFKSKTKTTPFQYRNSNID
ncbi:AraC family transcriptional regulator [Lacihabitans sp. CCS-44]|uniref:AraC family transcriptional regulator n=1 Tax=Lacihabitans sp. CCS-44 TaxID=2487331 RepID=UPI0020CCFF7E|nr:response regulator transcription factor [Lacihabitans sp. CCS-44]MCP9755463.1 AraC family transcriptional regulator [Lacihabitans sp. CCS-44]